MKMSKAFEMNMATVPLLCFLRVDDVFIKRVAVLKTILV